MCHCLDIKIPPTGFEEKRNRRRSREGLSKGEAGSREGEGAVGLWVVMRDGAGSGCSGRCSWIAVVAVAAADAGLGWKNPGFARVPCAA